MYVSFCIPVYFGGQVLRFNFVRLERLRHAPPATLSENFSVLQQFVCEPRFRAVVECCKQQTVWNDRFYGKKTPSILVLRTEIIKKNARAHTSRQNNSNAAQCLTGPYVTISLQAISLSHHDISYHSVRAHSAHHQARQPRCAP